MIHVVGPPAARERGIGARGDAAPRARGLWPAVLVYLGSVFATGVALGAARVIWLAPRWGERRAELAELPLMLLASWLAARWVVARFDLARRPRRAWVVGLVALACLIALELASIAWLRPEGVAEYVARRDPISGAAYLLALALFAAFPALVAGARRSAVGASGRAAS